MLTQLRGGGTMRNNEMTSAIRVNRMQIEKRGRFREEAGLGYLRKKPGPVGLVLGE